MYFESAVLSRVLAAGAENLSDMGILHNGISRQ